MNIEKLSEPLSIDNIEFRIQSINKGGYATILAYKDARVDMQRLDEAVGALNWRREHCRDNHNCIVSIWNEATHQWVSKEDTGTESNTEQQKGLASDSFKRACFNWGIGRELYDYPLIQIKLNGDGKNQKDEWWLQDDKYPKSGWGLKLKSWRWDSEFTNGMLTLLVARDEKGKERFRYSTFTPEQKSRFDLYFNNQDALRFFLFIKSLPEEVYTSLYNSFESGKKMEGKKIAGQLEREGQVEAQGIVDTVTEMLTGEIDPAWREEMEGLERDEKKVLAGMFDKETLKIMENLK